MSGGNNVTDFEQPCEGIQEDHQQVDHQEDNLEAEAEAEVEDQSPPPLPKALYQPLPLVT